MLRSTCMCMHAWGGGESCLHAPSSNLYAAHTPPHIHSSKSSITHGGEVAGTPENEEVFSLHPLEPRGCKAVSPWSLAISVRVAKKNLPL